MSSHGASRVSTKQSAKTSTGSADHVLHLVGLCKEAFSSFKPSMTTVDAHIDEFIASANIDNDGDGLFLQQVVYGMVRYKKMLKVLLTALYFKHGSEVSRDDYGMYMIYAYLAVIRLDDLGASVFTKFILAQDAQKMNVFLGFIFNEQTLNKWLKDEWCKLFDENYVVDTLIGRLMRGRAELQHVLAKIKAKAEGASAAAPVAETGEQNAAEKKAYEFQLFNITQPRPRMLPEPFKIPVGFKANPVPSSVLQPSSLQSKVAEKCKEVREETIARHKTYSSFNFTERPMEIDRLREEAAQREEEQTRYIAPKVNPPPNIPPEKQEKVRLNAAAILREDALLKKKQQQEAASLLKYESELRDASQFEAWKAAMLSKDEEERLALVEKRRVEMIMTDAAAREARERAVLENKALAANVTKEMLAGFEEVEKLQRAELEKKKEIVKRVQEGEASAGIGKEKLVGVRLEAAQKQKEQIREQLIAAEKEREKEREVRMDLVRQIRALSIVPPKITDFDPTDTPEHGLLDQMSIAELKERLAFVRQQDEELREEKRAAIILAKQQKERELLAKVESIARVRDLASKESVTKKTNRHAIEKDASEKIRLKREAQMEELQQKIEKQRAARLSEAAALEEEMRQIRIKKQFLAAGASQMEEKKWMEIEKGAERAIADRVSSRNMSEAAKAHALREDEANRAKHYHDIELQREQFAKMYEVKVQQKREVAELESAAELAHKATLAQTQKQFESTLHQKVMSSKANAYYSDLKAATIDKGRTTFVAKK